MKNTLVIKTETKIIKSNLDKFGHELMNVINGINTKLKTDDDFYQASKDVKTLQEAEKALKEVRESILSDSGLKEISDNLIRLHEATSNQRLKLYKLVEKKKAQRKQDLIEEYFDSIKTNLDSLEFATYVIPAITQEYKLISDLQDCIKGKSKLDSMESALALYAKEVSKKAESLVRQYQAKFKKIKAKIKGREEFFDVDSIMRSDQDPDIVIDSRLVALEREKQAAAAKAEDDARLAAEKAKAAKQPTAAEKTEDRPAPRPQEEKPDAVPNLAEFAENDAKTNVSSYAFVIKFDSSLKDAQNFARALNAYIKSGGMPVKQVSLIEE
jgi:hypothetical protein